MRFSTVTATLLVLYTSLSSAFHVSPMKNRGASSVLQMSVGRKNEHEASGNLEKFTKKVKLNQVKRIRYGQKFEEASRVLNELGLSLEQLHSRESPHHD